MSASEDRGRRRHHRSRRRHPGGSHDRHRRRRPRRRTARHGHGHHAKEVRFATFNASLNRGARRAGRPTSSTPDNAQAQDGGRDHPAQPARRAAGQRVRLRRRRRGGRAVPRQLPRGRRRTAPARSHYPYYYVRRVQHRHPQRLRPQQQRRRRRPADDAFGFGFFPGQFGMVVYSKYPIDTDAGPHLPALPLEGHARRDAARRPRHARARRLVLRRGARRLPALQQVALGPADPDRRRDRALPGLPPDAAGVRRRRGPQRHPQLRRDPVLGRLRARRHAGGVHLRRRGPVRRAASRRSSS